MLCHVHAWLTVYFLYNFGNEYFHCHCHWIIHIFLFSASYIRDSTVNVMLCASSSIALGINWFTHSGWTPFYFMYDPKCSTTFPWCTINAPVVFAWCTINVPAAFARCTNRFVHKVEFSYIGWNGVHPLCYGSAEGPPRVVENRNLLSHLDDLSIFRISAGWLNYFLSVSSGWLNYWRYLVRMT